MIEYEHLPLGKVQGWVRPGKAIFETLFSVSVNQRSESKLWDIIESEPPQADVSFVVAINELRRTQSILHTVFLVPTRRGNSC